MVDIARALTSSNHPSKNAPDVRLPYMIEVTVTAAQMIAAKGSAIAAADVFDVVKFPAGTVIRGVWARKTGAFAGSSTDLTLDVGITGVDADAWVDGWDFDGAALGSYATPVGVGFPATGTNWAGSVTNAVQTVTVLVATQTGTWTGGEITFYAECLDLSDRDNSRSGIVQLGS